MQAYTQAERPTIRTERVVPGGHDVEGTAFETGDGDWVVLQGGDLDVHSPPVVHLQAQEHPHTRPAAMETTTDIVRHIFTSSLTPSNTCRCSGDQNIHYLFVLWVRTAFTQFFLPWKQQRLLLGTLLCVRLLDHGHPHTCLPAMKTINRKKKEKRRISGLITVVTCPSREAIASFRKDEKLFQECFFVVVVVVVFKP